MRALTPWRPFRELSTLHNEIDDLFSQFLGEGPGRWTREWERTFVPSIESYARDGSLVVRADLPGIDPKDVEVSVENDRLTIKGERRVTHEDKQTDHMYREISYGSFQRVINLPTGVDAESVKAEYHDGVLEITMKAPEKLVSKKVPITVH